MRQRAEVKQDNLKERERYGYKRTGNSKERGIVRSG